MNESDTSVRVGWSWLRGRPDVSATCDRAGSRRTSSGNLTAFVL